VNVIAKKYCQPVSETIMGKNDRPITPKTDALARWCEYFSELLNHDPPAQPMSPLNSTSRGVPYVISEQPPTSEKISKAIKQLKSGRASGSDGLPPDLFKILMSR